MVKYIKLFKLFYGLWPHKISTTAILMHTDNIVMSGVKEENEQTSNHQFITKNMNIRFRDSITTVFKNSKRCG